MLRQATWSRPCTGLKITYECLGLYIVYCTISSKYMSMKLGVVHGGEKLVPQCLRGFRLSVYQAVGVHVLFPFFFADASTVQEEDEGHVGGFLFGFCFGGC